VVSSRGICLKGASGSQRANLKGVKMATKGTHALTNIADVRQEIDAYFEGLTRYSWQKIWNPQARSEKGELGDWDLKEMPDGEDMPGIAGLSYHLGINRRTFLNWCDRAKDETEPDWVREIARELIRAKSRIEMYQEQGLFDKTRHRGSMFSLSVNYKWRDGEETERGKGEAFVMNIIPPAEVSNETLAIPKWEPTEDE